MAYGPIPNRSEDLSRERDKNRSHRPQVKSGTMRPVTIPEPDPDWHPIATRMWESLKTSGQSDFYQDSDWAYAYTVMDDLSHYKKPSIAKDGSEYYKRSGQMLQTIMQSLTRLLVTEADRRQARIELTEEVEESERHLAVVHDYREGLGLS